MKSPALAFDKRTIDPDGHMHVPGCRISKANVCPYYGREIPGHEAMGLNPDAVYQLYRHPDELRKAAQSFENKPLLRTHTPVTADDHSPDDVVGVVSNIRYEHPYLVGDVSVWTQEGIDYITSEERKELSSAYRYVPVLGVGTSPEGLRYDVIMTNLLGNHVALVAEGRAGPDVVVADSAKGLPMKFRKTIAALANVLGATFTPPAQLAFDNALAEELAAADAANELDDVEKKAACDAMCKELGKDSLDDDEKREAYSRAAADKRRAADAVAGNANAPGAPEGGAPKPAQDAAVVVAPIALDEAAITAKAREGYVLAVDHVTVAAATQLATDAAALVHSLYAAREVVAEKVGVIALDGADSPKTVEAIYRKALDVLKVDHSTIAADALPAFYTATTTAATITSDSAHAAPFDVFAAIPALQNIRKG